jgi:hypothetical protein
MVTMTAGGRARLDLYFRFLDSDSDTERAFAMARIVSGEFAAAADEPDTEAGRSTAVEAR